jgi:hypothetical protein
MAIQSLCRWAVRQTLVEEVVVPNSASRRLCQQKNKDVIILREIMALQSLCRRVVRQTLDVVVPNSASTRLCQQNNKDVRLW